MEKHDLENALYFQEYLRVGRLLVDETVVVHQLEEDSLVPRRSHERGMLSQETEAEQEERVVGLLSLLAKLHQSV